MKNTLSKLLLLAGVFLSSSSFAQSIKPPPSPSNLKPMVMDVASLPATGNTAGDMRIALDTFDMYVWDGATWQDKSGSGGGATWGMIGGVLSNQVDLQNALNLKAPLASPALTGNPTAPTQAANDNSTKIATTAYADNAASSAASAAIVQTITNGDTTHASSSDALFDALALKFDSANFSTSFNTNFASKTTDDLTEGVVNLYFTDARARTAAVENAINSGTINKAPSEDAVFNALALKAPLASPAFTGNPTAPTQAANDSSTKLATTAYADNAASSAVSNRLYDTDGLYSLKNTADNTKTQKWDLSGQTTGTAFTISPLTTANNTLNVRPLVDATGNMVVQNGTSGQIFIGADATIGGSNAGVQYSSTVTNRGQFKAHSYSTSSSSVAGIATLTSRSGTIGSNTSIGINEDYSKWTAQAAATTAGSAPISGTFAFKSAGTINALTVPSLFHVQLTNLAGTLGDRLSLSSEGALQLPGYTSGIAHFDGSGNITSSAVSLTSDISGILPIANGGTNSSTALSGSSIMISDGTSIVQGAAGTSTTLLHGNASGAPTYSAASLTADVSGILPRANGGTNNNSFLTTGVVYADATTLKTDATSAFTYDDTNKRLSINGAGTGKLNGTVTSGTDLAITGFCTGSNNCVSIQNQSGYSMQLTNAASSALAGASLGGAFSRGTLAARTQSLAGDQLFSLTSQGYTGSAFGPGLSGAISFVATENSTASANGNLLAFATTPNGSLTPVSRMTIGQNGVVNISNLTASLPVQTNASKDLVSAAINLSGSQVTSTLGVANGGTGSTALAANNVLLGNGTSALQVVAPGTSGNILTSNGTTWTSAAPVASNTLSIANISSNTTGSSGTGVYFGDTSGGAFTFTLPAASSNSGVRFHVKNITFGGANNISVSPSGGDTIDGMSGDTITPGEGKTYISNGTAWYLVS